MRPEQFLRLRRVHTFKPLTLIGSLLSLLVIPGAATVINLDPCLKLCCFGVIEFEGNLSCSAFQTSLNLRVLNAILSLPYPSLTSVLLCMSVNVLSCCFVCQHIGLCRKNQS